MFGRLSRGRQLRGDAVRFVLLASSFGANEERCLVLQVATIETTVLERVLVLQRIVQHARCEASRLLVKVPHKEPKCEACRFGGSSRV